VQRLVADGGEDGERCEDQRDGGRPERAQEVRAAKAHRGPSVERYPGGGDDKQHGNDVEWALRRAGTPDDGKDEDIADRELQEVAEFGGGGGLVNRLHE